MRARPLRWLFVACDGVGLGHLSRTLGLASALRRRQGDAEILFLTNSEASQILWRRGFATVKFPALEFADPQATPRLAVTQYDAVSQAVVDATLQSFRPDIAVVDTFPYGQRGEYLPILRGDMRRVLIRRELFNYEANPDFQKFLALYDHLIHPYEQGEIDLECPPGVPAAWVGPIFPVGAAQVLPAQEAADILRLRPGRLRCLVSLGGGGVPNHRQIETWLMQVAAAHRDIEFVLTESLLLPTLRSVEAPDNVSIVSHFPIAECFSAFDFAIVRPGVTLTETAAHGLPAIVIPHSTVQDEDQDAKAERHAGPDGPWLIEELDTAALEAALADLAQAEIRARVSEALKRQFGATNGAELAADLLADWSMRIDHS